MLAWADPAPFTAQFGKVPHSDDCDLLKSFACVADWVPSETDATEIPCHAVVPHQRYEGIERSDTEGEERRGPVAHRDEHLLLIDVLLVPLTRNVPGIEGLRIPMGAESLQYEIKPDLYWEARKKTRTVMQHCSSKDFTC